MSPSPRRETAPFAAAGETPLTDKADLRERGGKRCRSRPAVLFLGPATPDDPRCLTKASSPAANAFQRSLVAALHAEAETRTLLYSPTPSWPRGPLFRSGRKATLNGLPAKLLGFLNLAPLKALTMAPAIAIQALLWAWRSRRAERTIVVYNLSCPPALPALLAARLTGSRLIPFLCDVLVPGETVPDTLSRRAQFALERWTIRHVDGRVVVNPNTIHDFAPGAHHLVVEAGIERAEAERLGGERPPRAAGPLRVLYAGGLDELHGIDLLLDALAQNPEWQVEATVLGRGPLADRVAKAAETDPRLTYRGLVDRERVLSLYRGSDVLLSLCKGSFRTLRYLYPSKVIECLASGTPLLTTLPGNTQTAFGEVSWSLVEETPTGLYKALRAFESEPEPARLARAAQARRLILETRTWDAQVRRLMEYRRTLS